MTIEERFEQLTSALVTTNAALAATLNTAAKNNSDISQTKIAAAVAQAVGEHTKELAQAAIRANEATAKIAAENTRAIAELTRNLNTVHDSLKSLGTIAETLVDSTANLEKEWQAYLMRQPSH